MSRLRSPFLLPALAGACLLLTGSDAIAFSGGPPASRTGAPTVAGNEQTCADFCHTSFALDSGPGSVTIIAPPDYLPGELIEIMVVVEQTGMQRWGFQLTALDNALAGVGELVPDDVLTQLRTSGDRDYVEHTSLGTANGQLDANTFSFDWQAPESDAGPVTFYAVGNAADGSLTNQGDQIYSDSITITLPEPAAGTLGATALVTLLAVSSRSRRRERTRSYNRGFGAPRRHRGQASCLPRSSQPETRNPHPPE